MFPFEDSVRLNWLDRSRNVQCSLPHRRRQTNNSKHELPLNSIEPALNCSIQQGKFCCLRANGTLSLNLKRPSRPHALSCPATNTTFLVYVQHIKFITACFHVKTLRVCCDSAVVKLDGCQHELSIIQSHFWFVINIWHYCVSFSDQ